MMRAGSLQPRAIGGFGVLAVGLVFGCGQDAASPDDGGAADARVDAGPRCSPMPEIREEITAEFWERPRIALDAEGGVHVAYHREPWPYTVEYAHRDPISGAWTRETALSLGAGIGGIDLAVRSDGTVHLVADGNLDGLIYAHRASGGEWEREFDILGGASARPAMAVDDAGALVVCGYDPIFNGLGCAHRSPEGIWEEQLVDVGKSVAWNMAMAMGPDGTAHLLFGGYEFGVNMQIGHAWRTRDGGSWESEWATEPEPGGHGSIALAVDGVGTLHGMFDHSPSETLENWWSRLSYVRKAPGDSGWSRQEFPNDSHVASLSAGFGGEVRVVFTPVLPYHAASRLVFARRVVDGSWKQARFGCNVLAPLLVYPHAALDDCCVHVVHPAVTTFPGPLIYQRYCPSGDLSADLGDGQCLTDLCASEVAACENAWCPGDTNPVSNCERAAMNVFPTCDSYDFGESCPDLASCPEVVDAATGLVNCIRERCYGPCE